MYSKEYIWNDGRGGGFGLLLSGDSVIIKVPNLPLYTVTYPIVISTHTHTHTGT